jgi:hypothetical protein
MQLCAKDNKRLINIELKPGHRPIVLCKKDIVDIIKKIDQGTCLWLTEALIATCNFHAKYILSTAN